MGWSGGPNEMTRSCRPETRRDVLIAPPLLRDRIRRTRFDSRNHPNLLIPTPPSYCWRTWYLCLATPFPTPTPTPTPFRGSCGVRPSSTCVGSGDASALPGLTSVSSACITLALGSLMAAPYARRATTVGAIASSWVTVIVVVLAAGIISGALTPDLSLLTDTVGMVLKTVRHVLG